MIYQEIGEVISNEQISEGIFKTNFYTPLISSTARTGQFINILPSSNWGYVMRRPMSIASQGDDEVSIIFKVIGEGTRIMAEWENGEKVDLIGPLGNSWKGYNITHPILIGGGVGIAPILNLHTHLLNCQIKHILVMGAKNEREHFLKHEPGKRMYMSTDDGSFGIHGNVVDAMKTIFPNANYPDNTKIFSCGPPLMMESIRTYAHENHLLCDLALETVMACGFGICQGCTIERKLYSNSKHTYRNRFALACMDGPIFDSREIISCR